MGYRRHGACSNEEVNPASWELASCSDLARRVSGESSVIPAGDVRRVREASYLSGCGIGIMGTTRLYRRKENIPSQGQPPVIVTVNNLQLPQTPSAQTGLNEPHRKTLPA